MAGTMPEAGPIGRNLIANVDQLRQARGLSWNKLSAALAQVLGVTPAGLLLPPGDLNAGPPEDHAAIREARNLTRRIETLIEGASDPDVAQVLSGYVDRALRRVQIEVEELLDETAREARAS
jgi:hypothetical protein